MLFNEMNIIFESRKCLLKKISKEQVRKNMIIAAENIMRKITFFHKRFYIIKTTDV